MALAGFKFVKHSIVLKRDARKKSRFELTRNVWEPRTPNVPASDFGKG